MIIKLNVLDELDMLLGDDYVYEEVDEVNNKLDDISIDGYEEIEHNIPIENFRYIRVEPEEYEIDYSKCVEGGTLNELIFANEYINKKLLIYDNGMFYTAKGGFIPRLTVKHEIIKILNEKLGMIKDLDRNAEKVVKVIETIAYNLTEGGSEKIRQDKNIIPLKNGTLFVGKKLFVENYFLPTLYRLNVELKPTYNGVPTLDKWIANALEPRDVKAFQDYMGYMLVPNTDAQVCMFMIGDANIGKSTLGEMLSTLFGEAFYNTGELAKFLDSRFDLSQALNKLCLFTDDIGSTQLQDEGAFKSLITARDKVKVEAKGKDVEQRRFYGRFLIFGNRMLEMPNNVDEGFTRRLVPIFAKARNDNFVPDPQFGDKLIKEKNDIFVYFLMGLYDLKKHSFRFDEIISEESKSWKITTNEDTDTYTTFFNTCVEVTGDNKDFISNLDMLNEFKNYCRKNAINYFGNNTDNELRRWMREHYIKLKFEPHSKGSCRGYKKIKFKDGVEN